MRNLRVRQFQIERHLDGFSLQGWQSANEKSGPIQQ